MPPWAQCPLGAANAVCGCVCLEGGVINTHGDHAVALRGIILVRPVAQVRSPNFYQSTANFRKALAQSAAGSVWS
jgi:hypothetical protein